MTIVVGVATPEGLVLAGDSRGTLLDADERHRIASDSVQKVFKVGRFGVANYGALLIGTETVAGLMDQFTATLDGAEVKDAEELAANLQGFVSTKFSETLEEPWDVAKQGYALGFLVAGYDPGGVGHIHHVTIPATDLAADITTAGRGMIWQGQQDVFNRLYYGYDPNRLAATGVSLPEEAGEVLDTLRYVLNDPLTIQDGVDCACFIVRTTVDMQRFSMGAACDGDRWEVPGCGGPVQVLAIERSGSTWVEQLQLTAPKRPAAAEGELL